MDDLVPMTGEVLPDNAAITWQQLTASLNDRQRLFCLHYAETFSATRAAKLAGYAGNDDSLAAHGSRLMNDATIRAAIDYLLQQRHVTENRIKAELAEIVSFDPSVFIDDKGKIDLVAARDAGALRFVKRLSQGKYQTSVEWYSRLDTLLVIAKILHMLHPHEIEVPDIESRSDDDLKRLAGDTSQGD